MEFLKRFSKLRSFRLFVFDQQMLEKQIGMIKNLRVAVQDVVPGFVHVKAVRERVRERERDGTR